MQAVVCSQRSAVARPNKPAAGVQCYVRKVAHTGALRRSNQVHHSTVCRVKFDAELAALLQAAEARSSCTVGDRVGIIGLKFAEEGRENEAVMEAGIQLGIYLRDYRSKDLRGRTFLELGSGIGVAGLTAAAFGANALLTDLCQVAQATTAKNVRSNTDLVRGAGGLAQVAELDWAHPPAELVAGPWDYIIGSDLVYDDSSPHALASLLVKLLDANPQASVLFAHVHRSDALDDTMTEVFGRAGLEIGAAPRDAADAPDRNISIISVRRA